jgi:hypothetical protein
MFERPYESAWPSVPALNKFGTTPMVFAEASTLSLAKDPPLLESACAQSNVPRTLAIHSGAGMFQVSTVPNGCQLSIDGKLVYFAGCALTGPNKTVEVLSAPSPFVLVAPARSLTPLCCAQVYWNFDLRLQLAIRAQTDGFVSLGVADSSSVRL